VRILAVVPIFAVNAWVSLLVESSRKHWASPLSYIRELYESVAMLSFMQFVLACLGGPVELAQTLRRERGGGPDELVQHAGLLKHVLRPYRVGPDLVARVSTGILQYVAISLALFTLNCMIWRPPWDQRLPWFHESRVYVEAVIRIVKAVSCGWAMYNLAMFYHQVHSHLEPFSPVLKFLSIKGVIFFTFWQSIVIFVLGRLEVIPNNPTDDSGHVWSQRDISAGIQHFLICLEMVIFAEMHRRAYPLPLDEAVGRATQHRPQSTAKQSGSPLADIVQLWREIRILRLEASALSPEDGASLEVGVVVGRGNGVELSQHIEGPLDE